MQTYTINCSGKLIDFSQPKVMGILNVTPDSFFAESRKQSDEEIHRRVQQMVDEGAQMMQCFWTGRALVGAGILLAVLNIFFCITKSAQTGIAVSNILIALYAAAVPTVLIGTCKMPTMMCNAHTKPAVFLTAGLFIIANAVYLVLARKER